jgi:ATP-binding cassette subfamily C (CFTR/MRP) protein 1
MYVYFLAGEIVNLISVDSQKIEDACLMINLMWSCPLQVGLAIYFLYQTIGVSVFVGKTIFLFTLRLRAYMRNRVH